MGTLEVIDNLPASRERRLDVQVLLAFFAIYFLWGATFLAIRVAVLEIPPFFTAGVRFFTAGAFLYLVLRLRGEPAPSAVQWRSIAVIAVCMFVVTYGALFWAEQFVPSGITAVLEATLPLIAMIFEVFVFRKQRFRWRMLAAVALGLGGIALLLLKNTGQSFGVFPCLVILAGSVAWTLGAVLTRSMPLPKSVPLAAGAEMMLGGAVLLALALVTGEMHPFPHIPLRAAVALLYLIVGGSLVGFTAYVWLLAQMPATRVASHAYVNPLVAVALGYFVAGEEITPRMLLAAVLVVASVFLILKPPSVTGGSN
jgi:drug/metabolite transporter (DMT)-like permease